MKFNLLTVFNYGISNSKSFYLSPVVMIGHKLDDGTAETSLDAAILHRHYFFEFAKSLMQHFFIQWFYKTQIIVRYVHSLLFHSAANFYGIIANVPNGKNGQLLSVLYFASCSNFNFFKRRFPIWHYSLSARVAD